MGVYKASTIDIFWTHELNKVHQEYQKNIEVPVKLVRYGETLDLEHLAVGETETVMAWNATGTRGEYRVIINKYQRIE